ncbi:MAG: DNA-processing protein DprA [Bacteroidaceae bacterium]|nr:DNA-processing protein DprA [Bacteroidaceae bacterium]
MLDDQELLYTMALTRVFAYNSSLQQQMLQRAGSATAIYENRCKIADMIPDISPRAALMLERMEMELPRCEEELLYARSHHIKVLAFQDDANYPVRLRQCEDAPLILYFLGHADLNASHIVSVVGTRHCTEYGREMCSLLASELRQVLPDTLIVSGLAYGIDIAAHRAALSNSMATVGVLAHGLDEIYPRLHRNTAVEMLAQGGLLTELMSYSHIDKVNFVQRNRIVAGIADATIVVESAAKGGSLITANIANGYNREVFAIPGRVRDKYSVGCNELIRNQSATLITSVTDLLSRMGWESETAVQKADVQQELFPQLTNEETLVAATLKNCQDATFSDLVMSTALPSAKLTSVLMMLEMKGVIKKMAGNRYHLLLYA